MKRDPSLRVEQSSEPIDTPTEAFVVSGKRIWSVSRTKFYNQPDSVNYVTIHDGNSSICKMTASEGMQIADVPDAALIVRAVNNHDALVKALEDARKLLDVSGAPLWSDCKNAVKIIDAALAGAKQ